MDSSVTIRTRKLVRNPLLKRRQFIVDVIHPGRPVISKSELEKEIVKMFKGADLKATVLFGFKTTFGGGRSSGFGFIYDDVEALKSVEPRHRLIRKGYAEKKKLGRKAAKEAKRKSLTTWGTGRRAAARKARRAAAA